MSAIAVGPVDLGLRRTSEGHRDYGVTWLVRLANYNLGPQTAMLADGLPQVGDPWIFGSEADPAALCHPDWEALPVLRGEPSLYYTVSQTFSTRPLRRCQDVQIENPLLEPPEVGGSFVNYVKEIRKDRNDVVLKMSSHELVRGALMEFDHSNPTVTITVNHPALQLPVFTSLQHHLNDATLWGLSPRMVKLSNTTWAKRYFGVCNWYFRKTYEFEINFETFDRHYPDIGTRVLQGHCPGSSNEPLDPEAIDSDTGLPNWLNVANFELYRDMNGDIIEEIPLDGRGRPAFDEEDQAEGDIEFYPEGNLLLLGIPTNLEF